MLEINAKTKEGKTRLALSAEGKAAVIAADLLCVVKAVVRGLKDKDEWLGTFVGLVLKNEIDSVLDDESEGKEKEFDEKGELDRLMKAIMKKVLED